MHALHRILVNISDYADCDREEIIENARGDAEVSTEDYFGRAFDWRVTDSAGRWIYMYPENVILSKENMDKVLQEIETCKESQNEQKSSALEELGKITLDLNELVTLDNNGELLPLYYLRQLSAILCGIYTFDSMFFDADIYSSKITDDTFQKIKESPDNWALVLFDVHY